MRKVESPTYIHQPYPKNKYHATHDPVIVQSEEEEEYLPKDEWKDSPADFGIITHPSKEQMMKEKLGFNFEELKAKKVAERNAAVKKLLKPVEEEELEEIEDGEESEEKPKSARNRRK